MRCLFGFLWVLALGCGDEGIIPDPCQDVVCDDNDACTSDRCYPGESRHHPVVCNDGNVCTEDRCDPVRGCETTPVDDGTPCGDGARVCEAGTCVGDFACTERGIRDAIAEQGGPHTFECEGPTTVSTSGTIFINRSVILDGEDNLIVDGNDHHRVFNLSGGTIALRRMRDNRRSSGDKQRRRHFERGYVDARSRDRLGQRRNIFGEHPFSRYRWGDLQYRDPDAHRQHRVRQRCVVGWPWQPLWDYHLRSVRRTWGRDRQRRGLGHADENDGRRQHGNTTRRATTRDGRDDV